ncbi:hypothetical protein HB943_11615 [Listeria weihenstephanensis]|uniref:Uncharacterized protein n=1 Tax=Listeria weihenstephanensis TaxID=1006155 RepID=A0A841Z5M7_9LIST|nr:hypothetical protein [Listeria weihenstephanensis]MBC1501251.1 hypothetical protein [Listeria weihenstephanensis]
MKRINENMKNLLAKISDFKLTEEDLVTINEIVNVPFVELEGCLFIKVTDTLTPPEIQNNQLSKAEIEYNYNELCLNNFFEEKNKWELINLGVLVLEGWSTRFMNLFNKSPMKFVLTCSDDEAYRKWFKELDIEMDEVDNVVLLRLFRVRNEIENNYFSQEYLDNAELDDIYVLEN